MGAGVCVREKGRAEKGEGDRGTASWLWVEKLGAGVQERKGDLHFTVCSWDTAEYCLICLYPKYEYRRSWWISEWWIRGNGSVTGGTDILSVCGKAKDWRE